MHSKEPMHGWPLTVCYSTRAFFQRTTGKEHNCWQPPGSCAFSSTPVFTQRPCFPQDSPSQSPCRNFLMNNFCSVDLAEMSSKPSYTTISVQPTSVTPLLRVTLSLTYFSDAMWCNGMEERKSEAPDLACQLIPYLSCHWLSKFSVGRLGRPRARAISLIRAISSFGEPKVISFALGCYILFHFVFINKTMKNETWNDDIYRSSILGCLFLSLSNVCLGNNAQTSQMFWKKHQQWKILVFEFMWLFRNFLGWEASFWHCLRRDQPAACGTPVLVNKQTGVKHLKNRRKQNPSH